MEAIGELDVDTFDLGGDVVVTTEDAADEEDNGLGVAVLVEAAKVEEIVGGLGVVVEMGCFVGVAVDGGTLGSKTHSSGVVARGWSVARNGFSIINSMAIGESGKSPMHDINFTFYRNK